MVERVAQKVIKKTVTLGVTVFFLFLCYNVDFLPDGGRWTRAVRSPVAVRGEVVFYEDVAAVELDAFDGGGNDFALVILIELQKFIPSEDKCFSVRRNALPRLEFGPLILDF